MYFNVHFFFCDLFTEDGILFVGYSRSDMNELPVNLWTSIERESHGFCLMEKEDVDIVSY